MLDNTTEWAQFETGRKYKSSINLYDTVDKNERFYAKRHWEGVKTNGLPAAQLPYSKRIVDFKIAMVMADLVKMTFSAQGADENDPNSLPMREIAKLMTDYAMTTIENTKFDTLNENGLLDCALSGDMISYWWWDDEIDLGNGIKGDIRGELVDNVNLFLGDVNNPVINDVYGPVQPYIIIAFRRVVSEVKAEAKKYGASKDDLDKIVSDEETDKQAGLMSKKELEDEETRKCTVLLKMWVKDKKIFAQKSTKHVVIRKEWDMKLTRYPVALMNWDLRKNSCHGEAEMTALIPNQIVINQMASMIALWIKLHGYPRIVIDKPRVPSWTNDLSKAIEVNGAENGVGSAVQYLQPGQLSAAVQTFFDTFIKLTKESAGANDSILGDAAPTNTSAIVVNSKNSAVPLNSIKRRFYRYVEDVGLIWLDFWTSKYAEFEGRPLEITREGIKQVIPLDSSLLKKVKLRLKIDVGPSGPMDEAAQIQTLDNLLKSDRIEFVEYLERVPENIIPNKQGLIESRGSESDMQLLYKLVAEKAATLPPEVQQQLAGMNVRQAKDALKQYLSKNMLPPANRGGVGNAMSGVQ